MSVFRRVLHFVDAKQTLEIAWQHIHYYYYTIQGVFAVQYGTYGAVSRLISGLAPY